MARKRLGGKRLRRKAQRGFRGYPVATIAFYGPDADRASKVAVGIIANDADEVVDLKRWFSEEGDVRADASIGAEVEEFIKEHEVRSLVMPDRIIGCPHEEGKDYPKGQACPQCPYWEGRDRFTGERIN